MTDELRLPPHLKVLGEVWNDLAHWLARAIAPALPHLSDHLDRAQADRFTELSDRETRAMIEWFNRVILPPNFGHPVKQHWPARTQLG
jgi:hypothetical protein